MKAPPYQRIAWVWHVTAGLLDKLAASGHDAAYIKAGCDGGGASGPILWQQWSDALAAWRAAGVEPLMMVYTCLGREYGTPAEVDAIVALCRRFLPRRIVLNYEVEGGPGDRGTDGMGGAEATAFVAALKTALAAFGDAAPALDNSSVPSWDGDRYGGSAYHDVPYEAVSAATEGDIYQDYWSPFSWQDGFQRKRQADHAAKFVVPSWIIGQNPADFAKWAAGAGYSAVAGWEAGNTSYPFGLMKAAFALLPALEAAILAGETAKHNAVQSEYKRIADAGFGYLLGLEQREYIADLTGILPTLPTDARLLATEKAVLWCGDDGKVDAFHRGQAEALIASGKARPLG